MIPFPSCPVLPLGGVLGWQSRVPVRDLFPLYAELSSRTLGAARHPWQLCPFPCRAAFAGGRLGRPANVAGPASFTRYTTAVVPVQNSVGPPERVHVLALLAARAFRGRAIVVVELSRHTIVALSFSNGRESARGAARAIPRSNLVLKFPGDAVDAPSRSAVRLRLARATVDADFRRILPHQI